MKEYYGGKEVMDIFKIDIFKFLTKTRDKLLNQKGQSTIEYALVTVAAGIISAILIAVGKPVIIELISKAFSKIASTI
jgi:Flp pilus assembly pilin Flp